jgi:hypothetical protein
MTAKQQIATGFLAVVIVGSIALMPVNAGVKDARAPAARPSASVATAQTPQEASRQPARDLTYN